MDVYSRNWRAANELVGGCAISLSRIPQYSEIIQEWHTLYPDGQNVNTVMGKVLLVMSQVPNEETTINFQYDRYEPLDDLNVWITTFNCGNVEPPENLEVWFPKIENETAYVDDEQIDLIVFGAQECEWGGQCEEEWISHLENYLGGGFLRVISYSLVEIRIFVFL